MPKTKKTKLPLGEILIAQKALTPKKLEDVLLLQKNNPKKLGEILLNKGICKPEEILTALAEQHSLKYQNHLEFKDPENIFKKIPIPFLNKHKTVPIKIKGKNIQVAIIDPLKIQPLDDLRLLFPEYDFEIVLALETEIQRIIHTHFDTLSSETTDDVIGDLEESNFDILSSQFSETEDIMDMANDAPIIRLVNTIVRQAITDRASDIHFEPYEKDLIVRFRIDGMLYKMFTPPKKYQSAIFSRIKIMANLNIAENRLPQDGRIQLKISGKDIDIRVSSFPTYYGERLVLRLLNKSDMKYDLNSLGFTPETLEKFNNLIKKTHGIILVTGPTGSGKSTTLYSALTRLNKVDVNILTVEDPIEYQLHGIGQMQVKPKIDLTFSNGLRSILRQDPDIVMIGEIRDLETAEIAVQAALTGHRVFSTLHTNDAASGITRLLEMGIEPFLIASSTNAYLAQRLIRKLCDHCKESYKPTTGQLNEIGIKASKFKNKKLYRSKGCPKCLETGYSGRLGIYELLPVTSEIKRLILAQADSGQIKEAAIKEGMITLLQDGISKAIEGVTTVEEVLRVS